MTYQEEYNALVERAKLTTPQHKGYGIERHHIVPRCMGGTDDDSNLVFFTYEQHINAHILLWKANPTNGKLAGAVCSMLDLTGTTAKSASARVEYLESLSDDERAVFINAASDARSEMHLPWNTSGFGRGQSSLLRWLYIEEMIYAVSLCDMSLSYKLLVDDMLQKLNNNRFLNNQLGENWADRNWCNKFIYGRRGYIDYNISTKYKTYGMDEVKRQLALSLFTKKRCSIDYAASHKNDLFDVLLFQNYSNIHTTGGVYDALIKQFKRELNANGIRTTFFDTMATESINAVIRELSSGDKIQFKKSIYGTLTTHERCRLGKLLRRIDNIEWFSEFVKANTKIIQCMIIKRELLGGTK